MVGYDTNKMHLSYHVFGSHMIRNMIALFILSCV